LVFRAGDAVDTLVVRGLYEASGIERDAVRPQRRGRVDNAGAAERYIRMDGRVVDERQPKPHEKNLLRTRH